MSAEKAAENTKLVIKKPTLPKRKLAIASGKHVKRMLGINLTEQNLKYLTHYRDSTQQSFNALVNITVDNARATDLLKGTPDKEPASIKKARIALENWDKKKSAGKKK